VQRNISDDALKLMLSYDWPGNIRELENCIERACALTSGPTVHIADLPTTIQNWREQIEPTAEGALPRRGIMPIAEMEKQAILGAIELLHGDKLEAARLLGIGKTTLYRKLKEYGALQ
jgi:two-component system response regulator HydG